MNWLDIVILCIFVVCIGQGIARGVIREGTALGGTVIGILIAYYYGGPVANWVTNRTGIHSRISEVLSFTLLALGTTGLISYLGVVASSLIQASPGRLFDVAGGALLGTVKALFIVSVILVIMTVLPWEQAFVALEYSALANELIVLVPGLYGLLTHVFDPPSSGGWTLPYRPDPDGNL